MEKVYNALVAVMFVVASIFTVSYGWTAGSSNKFMGKVEGSTANVLLVESGFIVIDFSVPVINTCGDTKIYGYITTQEGLTLQLKPLLSLIHISEPTRPY